MTKVETPDEDLPQIILRHVTGVQDRPFPNQFEGLVEDARASGLSVEELFDDVPPPERSIYNAPLDLWAMLAFASAWVISIVQPWYREDIYPWLRRSIPKLWDRFIRPDPDAIRCAIVTRDGVVPCEYSLTLCFEAPLKDGRIGKFLFKNECSEAEFERDALAFMQFLHDHWTGDGGGEIDVLAESVDVPARYGYDRILPLTCDAETGRVVVVKPRGDRRRRVEPTVGVTKGDEPPDDPKSV